MVPRTIMNLPSCPAAAFFGYTYKTAALRYASLPLKIKYQKRGSRGAHAISDFERALPVRDARIHMDFSGSSFASRHAIVIV